MMRKKVPHTQSLIRDILIIILSIIVAILMVRIGVLQNLLSVTQELALIGSFLTGIFFTSAFTIAPASIMLSELAKIHSPLVVALSGAAGAMVGDLIIFLFIKDRVADDIDYLLRKIKLKRILSILHLGFLRVFAPLIGALIIASPLPDELGIALMGITKMRTYILIPIAFVMNFLGILGIVAISQLF